ncbi:MAG: DUF4178 domain-containing protein [Myxococcaceae bacterium]|nr:DUF4178 domain-containing protein [Myxococcaceae bacterium]
MNDTAFNARRAKCPGCGATLAFKVGSARVVVCDHCSYAVGRTDLGFENLGKVADLVPTGARIALSARGKHEGVGFTVVGRQQLGWEQGVWDEWHIAFDDGRWGWLAEDDGRYFVSFQVHRRPTPRWEVLRVGRSVLLAGYRRFVVTEVRQARQIAAAGQLPGRVENGAVSRYADLSGQDGLYATLDYSEGEVPTIFVGREVTLSDLELRTDHLNEVTPPGPKIDVSALVCPQCRGPVSLQNAAMAKQVTCSYCNALLDTSQGVLRYLQQLPKWRPQWLGQRCTFFGVDYLTIGWMRRSGESDGETWFWEEYLLYDEASTSYRFLCTESGHWSFSTPIAAGDVVRVDNQVRYRDKNFKLFAMDRARVTAVLGEFFWSVRLGDGALCSDYIAPPEGLSFEQTADEITWAHEVYLQPEEVWAAYGSKEAPILPSSVGPLMPSPHAEDVSRSVIWSLKCLAAAAVLFALFAMRGPGQVLVESRFPTVSPRDSRASASVQRQGLRPSPAEKAHAVNESAPFEIEHRWRNLELAIDSNVDQSWALVSAWLVNQTTQQRVFVGQLESSRYYGVEGGEHWTEGSRKASTYRSSVEPGRYVLSVESAWAPGKAAPVIDVKLTQGVPRLLHFFLVVLVLLAFPAFCVYRNARFETERWRESDFNPFGGSDDDDDD